MRIRFCSFLGVTLLAGAVATAPVSVEADEYTVLMKGRSFSPTMLRIQPGDTVRFVNEDTVNHNVYSLTPDHFFTRGGTEPGKQVRFVFSRPGAFDVMSAAYYDRMKLHVEVASR